MPEGKQMYWSSIRYASFLTALTLLFAVSLPVGPGTADEAAGKPAGSAAPAEAGAYPGGPFILTDHHGKRVTDKDYRGRHMLVAFGYTYCPDICPLTLQDLAAVLDHLGPDADAIQMLFVTIDPERDSAEVLAEYIEAFDPRITGLTGSPAEIAAMTDAYGVSFGGVTIDGTPVAERKSEAGEEDAAYLMDHSAFMHLMAPDGSYLTSYLYGAPAEGMAADIRAYLKGSEGS
jgi:protein SCO1/2